MLVYPEIYGQDIDGNRGQIHYNAELQESDNDEIRAQLELMYEPGQVLYVISLYCHQYDSEHEFEININDYLTPKEIKGLT